jgi:GH24 family phage-related lysozyme (muramidase)
MLDSGNLEGVRNAISINTTNNGKTFRPELEKRRRKERDLFDGKRRFYYEAN